MSGPPRLMGLLLYGAGLRLMECCRLRVKDIDFSRNELLVRAGKGNKDRYTILPSSVRASLIEHLRRVKAQHDEDLKTGLGRVSLPMLSIENIPTPAENGVGSGCSWRPAISPTGSLENGASIISTSLSCNALLKRRASRRVFLNLPDAIPCVIHLPPTY